MAKFQKMAIFSIILPFFQTGGLLLNFNFHFLYGWTETQLLIPILPTLVTIFFSISKGPPFAQFHTPISRAASRTTPNELKFFVEGPRTLTNGKTLVAHFFQQKLKNDSPQVPFGNKIELFTAELQYGMVSQTRIFSVLLLSKVIVRCSHRKNRGRKGGRDLLLESSPAKGRRD